MGPIQTGPVLPSEPWKTALPNRTSIRHSRSLADGANAGLPVKIPHSTTRLPPVCEPSAAFSHSTFWRISNPIGDGKLAVGPSLG